MSSNYVRGASVTAAASQSEILEMLAGSGATGLRCTSEDGRAGISFASGGRQYRIVVVLPRSSDESLQPAGAGHAPKTAHEGARQRWRALAVLIRAKLDAVASGIVTFDQEFLAYALSPQRAHAPADPSRAAARPSA